MNEMPTLNAAIGVAESPQPDERRRTFVLQITTLEPMLSQYLTRFARNPSDVRDMVQETYLRLLASSGMCVSSYRSPQALVLTVARHIAIDWARHQETLAIEYVGDSREIDFPDELADCERAVDARQQLALIAEAVEQLPKKCREVFLLRKVHGLSHKEIALKLGVSDHTVEQHLCKAVRRIANAVPEAAAEISRVRRVRRRELREAA